MIDFQAINIVFESFVAFNCVENVVVVLFDDGWDFDTILIKQTFLAVLVECVWDCHQGQCVSARGKNICFTLNQPMRFVLFMLWFCFVQFFCKFAVVIVVVVVVM
jgi:hypothetical protein